MSSLSTFTAQEIANAYNSALDFYMARGQAFDQNIQSKPMLNAFNQAAGEFPSGRENVSIAVKAGQGGGSLQGYSGSDPVTYYNPANTKRVNFPWKEHHIGIELTHTELKIDGIQVTEDGGSDSTSNKSGRDSTVLVNMFKTKMDEMAEDYAVSLDGLIHGNGVADPKSLAGVQSFILENPAAGSTGGLSRVANDWWRNRAATAAFAGAGGQDAITSNPANGGALLQFMQKEWRQLSRYAKGNPRWRYFAGSDWMDAYETELRANGNYSDRGFNNGNGTTDGSMDAIRWRGKVIEYDPTLDDLGLEKRMYAIDMSQVKLMYMRGERMKRTNPARQHDRYVLYRGLTTTGVMVATKLNSSGVYDID